MLSYRPSNISGLRFLFSAIVAIGIVSASAAEAQAPPPQGTAWVVKVDVTQPNANGSWEIPHYTVVTKSGSPPQHTCTSSVPTSADRGDVLICPGDAVNWVTTTSGGGSVTVHDHDGVLLDTNNVPPYWIHNDTPSNSFGGTTKSGNSQTGAHSYAIAVYDPGATAPRPKLVLDDPQIVIGSGTVDALIISMKQNCGELYRSLGRDPEKSLAKKLCTQIDELTKIFRLP